MKARPITTMTIPATCLTTRGSSTRPPAPAISVPSTTKTVVKPATNGRLATRTRRPATPVSAPETAERYPGTSGRTHGVTNERGRPRRRAGSGRPRLAGRSSIDQRSKRELLVDARSSSGSSAGRPLRLDSEGAASLARDAFLQRRTRAATTTAATARPANGSTQASRLNPPSEAPRGLPRRTGRRADP